jgi:hypothetical protein
VTPFHGDTTIVRSTQGIEAVRRVTCVSNDIAVHALEVDVLPTPTRAAPRPARRSTNGVQKETDRLPRDAGT